MKTLRDYQRDAVDSLFSYWEGGIGRDPIVIAPTGSGKSLMIAEVCKRMMRYGARIAVLAHRKELLAQNETELRDAWPEAPTGVWSAGLGRKEAAPITFAGIASLARRPDAIGTPDLIIIDEAHMIPRSGATQYGRVLAHWREGKPSVALAGFTATPYRLDSGLLHSGEGAPFDGIAYDIGVRMLIDRGFLAPVRGKGAVTPIDLSGVRTRAGEFRPGDMESAALGIVESVADEVCRYGHDRKSWMLFASGVAHAEALTEALRARGIVTACVTGQTKDRDAILGAFKRGEIRALVNVDVLTTGFNAPGVDLLALVRATKSAALYVQMIGRGMRIAPDKSDCLVLDYGGNITRHGPIDDVTASPGPTKGEKRDAPAKECPACQEIVATSVRQCPECGHEFPPPAPAVEPEASDASPMSQAPIQRVLPVERVSWKRHRKRGKPDSICVTYHCGTDLLPLDVREWICPEHPGLPRRKYVMWCVKLGVEPRETVEETLEQEPPEVRQILVQSGKRYDTVLRRSLDPEGDEEKSTLPAK